MPALGTCDAFAPGLALGHAIGRVGCFAAGCCYGKETHHWWGVVFRNPLANSITGTPLNIPLEPTQLFESAVELANFFFLMWMLKRRKFDGQIFGAFLFIYGIARFFLEYLRDDPGRGSVFGGALTGTQLIAVGLVLAGDSFGGCDRDRSQHRRGLSALRAPEILLGLLIVRKTSIPAEKDWGDYQSDPDEKYRHDLFAGHTNERCNLTSARTPSSEHPNSS